MVDVSRRPKKGEASSSCDAPFAVTARDDVPVVRHDWPALSRSGGETRSLVVQQQEGVPAKAGSTVLQSDTCQRLPPTSRPTVSMANGKLKGTAGPFI